MPVEKTFTTDFGSLNYIGAVLRFFKDIDARHPGKYPFVTICFYCIFYKPHPQTLVPVVWIEQTTYRLQGVEKLHS